ncbi:MAG TPA: hypothetical protein VGU67_11610 [Edaphobacter sp.]|nr:hypothetical protein [Edaphobacter sp.]
MSLFVLRYRGKGWITNRAKVYADQKGWHRFENKKMTTDEHAFAQAHSSVVVSFERDG